jgi:hypothetical protein
MRRGGKPVTLHPSRQSIVAVYGIAAERATVILERFIGLLLSNDYAREGFCSLLAFGKYLGCHLLRLLCR